jgi:hypothetical protein
VPAAPYSVAQYLAEIRAIRNTGSATAETSFYPPVTSLFNASGQSLKPAVLFSTQLRNQGAGMPDGGFFPQTRTSRRNAEPPPLQNPERGVVEIKPADYDLAALAREPQTIRYLQQYGLVLITNLREFRLLQLDVSGRPHVLESYVLARTPQDLWHSGLEPKHEDLLPDFLRRVMLYRAPLVEPKDVAWLLASYAREARARAEDHPLASFDNVKLALQESLGIEFKGEDGEHFFRSTLVQTLFYGIFSAWVLWRRTPEGRINEARFNWRLSDDFLKVPILRKLFREVSDRTPLNSIQLTEVLDLAGEALNRVQPAFFTKFREEEAVAYFYEPFLEAFDPELRKTLGVWYTPKEIVQYMVERVDHLLRTELNQPLGLASTAVRILDPCCGTGAYLTAVLHRIHRTLLEQAGDDSALVPNNLRTAALSRIFGFEIMPAPFVIAHMEIARLLESVGAPIVDPQRAGVYLTNALTGWVPEEHPQSVIFEEFRREREDSENIKQQGTILVILGNPPYNGYAGIANIEEERDLTTAYRRTVDGLPAPQGQGLNDPYIRFFRIAERRIAGNSDGMGIVSFISNNAWLDGKSHPTMRYDYLQAFQNIYIDNLNGDKYRTGKTTPEGLPDPSAFSTPQNREGIQLGTAIATLVRNRTVANGNPNIRDLWGTGKLRQLEAESRHEIDPVYVPLTPVPALGLPFIYRVYTTAYTSWPRLTELFPVSFPGIKTSNDSFIVDIDRDRLEDRISVHLSEEVTSGRIPEDVSFKAWHTLRYTYRPFDVRWIYWDKKVPLIDRNREDYVSQMIGCTYWLEARQRENSDKFSRGTVANSVSDNFGNGLSTFFPAFILESAGSLLPTIEMRANLSAPAEAFIASRGAQVGDLFFHALATIHTPQYRSENSGALLGDWPRIPLPASIETLSQSAALGSQLAELLDAESSINLTGEWSFLGALKLPTPQNLGENLQVTAGWGSRGQGNTAMPGRGHVIEREWSPAEQDRLLALASSQGITLEQAIGLLGEKCLDIHLNGDTFWSAVPASVWEYTLGGYQVLKKWLSYREFILLGRPLHAEEAVYFAQVVRRITAILLLGPALEASYQRIILTANGLPPLDR